MSQELQRKLKEVRKKTGDTQKEFAKCLGVPLPTLVHWENDQRTPRGLALEALSTKLDSLLESK